MIIILSLMPMTIFHSIYHYVVPTESGVDCPGYDLDHLDTDFDTCSRKCEENAECAGFVYSTNTEALASCMLKTEGMCAETTKLPDTNVYKKCKSLFDSNLFDCVCTF